MIHRSREHVRNALAPKSKGALGKSRNPLRVDPTRTITIRRAFLTDLRKRFARLRGKLLRLVVDEDAFGLARLTANVSPAKPLTTDRLEVLPDGSVTLRLAAVKETVANAFTSGASQGVGNAFCATGPGGGVDPSCGKSEAEASPKGILGRAVARVNTLAERVPGVRQLKGGVASMMKGIHSRLEARYGTKAATTIMTSGFFGGYGVAAGAAALVGFPGIPVVNDLVSITAHAAVFEMGLQARRAWKTVTGNERLDYPALVRACSEEIAIGLRRLAGEHAGVEVPTEDVEGIKALAKSLSSLSSGGVTGNYLVLNVGRWAESPTLPIVLNSGRWADLPDAEKIEEFQKWLRAQFLDDLSGADEEELWKKYITQGYRKGAGRAFDDTRAAQRAAAAGSDELEGIYTGGREEFLRSAFGRPVAREKVELLAGRAFDDLEGVTSDMSVKMSRALTDGLVEGASPRDVAKDLEDVADLSESRAETVARTELIRAHAEGQLDAMESLGVEEVGVAVEWSTTGDDKVCEECEPLEGVVLTVDEARGMLPRHPNCRCAWIPANVGEEDEGQKDSKREIVKAIQESGEDEDWGPGVDIDVSRPRSVVNEADDATVGDVSFALSEGAMERFDAALNSFCATGEGGGVDPTCSPGLPAVSRLKPDVIKAAKAAGYLKSGADVITAAKAKDIKDALAGKKAAVARLAAKGEKTPEPSKPETPATVPEKKEEEDKGVAVPTFKRGEPLTREGIQAWIKSLPPDVSARKEMAKVLDRVAVPHGDVKEHDMPEAEAMKGVTIDGVKVSWSDKTFAVASSVIGLSADVPKALWDGVNHVVLSSQTSSQNAYWQKTLGDKNFLSTATGGGGKVVYYNKPLDVTTFTHEAGHSLAAKLWFDYAPRRDSEYGKAQELEAPVTNYGGHNRGEDFAEACRLYATEPERLKAFPMKYAALDKIMKGG